MFDCLRDRWLQMAGKSLPRLRMGRAQWVEGSTNPLLRRSWEGRLTGENRCSGGDNCPFSYLELLAFPWKGRGRHWMGRCPSPLDEIAFVRNTARGLRGRGRAV